MTKKKLPEWNTNSALQRYFTPTNESLYGECSKARFKNLNLPILQYMYNGDPYEPLKCLLSDAPGWVDFPCLVNSKDKQRFNIDFNHIRQEQTGSRVAGKSKDKLKYDPSHLFRTYDMHLSGPVLLEFMCIMPISQEYHRYITQDSALGHITLTSFDQKYWPWFLKNEANYTEFTTRLDLTGLSYDWFVNHLSDINNKSIHERVHMKGIRNAQHLTK